MQLSFSQIELLHVRLLAWSVFVCVPFVHEFTEIPEDTCLELLHVTAYVSKVCQSDLQLMWLDWVSLYEGSGCSCEHWCLV